ncbi:MAG TPA: isochorismatase family protein [Syntrophorhabdales bacterium]|nr:isochorismatase family protein [Syntrophorhabdales bacterium]
MTSNMHTNNTLLEREESLLVIIDVQERLLPAMAHREAVAENVRRLIAFSDIIGLPVIVTEQEKLGPTVPDLSHLKQPVKPISKVAFNCFLCDEFADAIRRSGKKTLILTGLEAHICVVQTALYAVPGFKVHTVRDAISSRTVDNWNTAVERMRVNGVTITSTEMVIYELLKQAGTAEFKAALALVK